ncbi:MAG: DUF362 domain-containing protein [Candidatus Bathyarchaeota archaeon]|nr:DUF362 domain-containing protein [Candidatus Bathyarchaeota archaeon]
MKPQNIRQKDLLHRLIHSGFIVGLVSMAWFILRTGTKPSRQTYPCQQIAKANTEIWLLAYIAPILAVGTQHKTKLNKNILATISICVILLATGTYYMTQKEKPPTPGASNNTDTTPVNPTNSTKPGENNTTPTIKMSNIFVVNGTQGGDGGIKKLIDLMGNNSLILYQSPTPGKNKGPTGLIANNDTVIIKINSQWDQRGGTNTDLLKEVIQAITEHPDGWRGEIIVADNGQAQYGSQGTGGSFTWTKANAQDHSQSVKKVVDSFDPKYRVSTYLWDKITETRVEEYSTGDTRDGYIVNATRNPRTGIMVSYPKFTTKYSTMISFKLGIWNQTTKTYDSDKLKVINMPVLKTHSNYGVSGCVKHYMGVVSDKITSRLGSRSHYSIANGAMGTEMTQTRYPILNILDCIWVNSEPLGGPYTNYSDATKVNMIVAGTDPVAIDYWSSKHILLRVTPNKSATDLNTMNPDNTTQGSFGDWLRLSMNEITLAGYKATVDESKMSIHITQLN